MYCHQSSSSYKWLKRGEYPDPFEACALSESSNGDVKGLRGALQDRYALLVNRRRRMHFDATLINELEKTRLDVILKQLEVEKSLQVCKFRKQEKRLRRSLDLLEGYKEKLKSTLTERAQELQRRNDKNKFVLRGEIRDVSDTYRDEERTESQIRKARQTITQRNVNGLLKQVNLEFRLPPLERDRLKMWTNPFDDGPKYERAKQIYGKPAARDEENADRSKFRVSFLPELAVHPRNRKYIKFTKGLENGDQTSSSKTSSLKGCLKKADSDVSLNKISLIAPSRMTDKRNGRESIEERRERNVMHRSRVSFPTVQYATREEASRENWLRRAREVKRRHVDHGAKAMDFGLKIKSHSHAKADRLYNEVLANSEGDSNTKLPALHADTE
ncbi:uncharacterized protein [Ptychodera flava]|uniref:uncharacterized protein isoform X2 n=1 Tax=Ptychodera flava TaxID=63121 RepID=UPI00396A6D10